MEDFARMTMSKLDRAVDKAVREENERFLAWRKAHPEACPNCMAEPEDELGCWLCDPKHSKEES